MRTNSLYIAAFLLLLLCVPVIISARHINRSRSRDEASEKRKDGKKKVLNWKENGGAETLEIAGSRLPDCSHACGSCMPCKLVMVSFVCASLAEAESCPMAYKCMCHNKSYPVP